MIDRAPEHLRVQHARHEKRNRLPELSRNAWLLGLVDLTTRQSDPTDSLCLDAAMPPKHLQGDGNAGA
jgi:hypothetical protein